MLVEPYAPAPWRADHEEFAGVRSLTSNNAKRRACERSDPPGSGGSTVAEGSEDTLALPTMQLVCGPARPAAGGGSGTLRWRRIADYTARRLAKHRDSDHVDL